MELFAKLVSNVNLKAVNYSRKKSYLRYLTGYRMPVGIYLLKVNIRNTRTKCEICSNLTIKTPERRHWRRSGIFIVNFEHISHLVLALLLLTLNI